MSAGLRLYCVAMAAGAVLVGIMLESPALAQTPPTAPAALVALAATAPLADRIQNAIDRYQSSGARPALDELRTLSAEAATAKGLDPMLAADLATIYAYSLARNKQADDAIAVIMAAENALTAAGHGLDVKMGDLLLAHAAFQDLKGDTDAALATKTRAQTLYIAVEGPQSTHAATVKAQIAFSLFARGQLNAALAAYADALPLIAHDDDSVRVYAMQMSNYASALRLEGELDRSLQVGRDALDVARAKLPEGHPAMLYSLNNLGTTLMEMGRYSEAETVLREAVDMARKYRGAENLDTAAFTYRLGQVLQREGHDDDAKTLLEAALAALNGVNTGANPDLPGLIQLELAQIAGDGGDVAGAQAHLQNGLDAIKDTGAVGDTTRSRLQTRLAELWLASGKLPEALSEVELSLPYYSAQMPAFAPDRIRADMVHALILSRLGKADEALQDALPVEAAMRAHLDDLGVSRREQLDLAAAYAINFTRFTDIALSAGRNDLAFEAAQMAALSEVATTSQALAARIAARDPAAADLARRLQDGQTDRLRLDRERTFALGKSDSDVQRLDGDIATLDITLKTVSASLDQTFPDFGRLSHPQPLALAAAQSALPSGQAVVMPLLSDDRVITLVVTHSGLAWDSAPLTRTQAISAVVRLRASVDTTIDTANDGFDRAPAWQLGQAMFTPKTMAALRQSDEIDILGSGPLMTLPFGLLLTAPPQGSDNDADALRHSAWLIRRFAISVKPAFLAAAPSDAAAGGGFIGIGAPVLSGTPTSSERGLTPDKDTVSDLSALRGLPGLPKAMDELTRMKSAFDLPGSTLMTGADATETHIKATPLGGYAVIAFATHGLISGNLTTLREPALVLTPPAVATADDDGLLTASDVAGLRLNARWVILSACNTGSGREDGAAGYSGLAKAFMQAGAQSLMVSLWPVRDDIADRLSVDTVRRNVSGTSQPQALRKAILSLMADDSVAGSANPAIWAPFSLVVR